MRRVLRHGGEPVSSKEGRALRKHHDLDVWKKAIELETQALIAKELGYCDPREMCDHMDDVFGLLSGLIRSLESRPSP